MKRKKTSKKVWKRVMKTNAVEVTGRVLVGEKGLKVQETDPRVEYRRAMVGRFGPGYVDTVLVRYDGSATRFTTALTRIKKTEVGNEGTGLLIDFVKRNFGESGWHLDKVGQGQWAVIMNKEKAKPCEPIGADEKPAEDTLPANSKSAAVSTARKAAISRTRGKRA